MIEELFSTPQYEYSFKRIDRFREWRDRDNCWLELVYYIARDRFVPMPDLTPLNLDLVARNGKKIFGNLPQAELDRFAARNYVLLDETWKEDNVMGDLYAVTQLYGYCPSVPYTYRKPEIVNIPGFVDTTAAFTENYSAGLSGYQSGDNFIFNLGTLVASKDIRVDDIVDIGVFTVESVAYVSGVAVTTRFSELSLPQRRISAINGTSITVSGGIIQGSLDVNKTLQILTSGNVTFVNMPGWRFTGPRFLRRGNRSRDPETIQTNVEYEVSFSFEEPALDRRFIVKNRTTGKQADPNTITDQTSPNSEEWAARIANGALEVWEEPETPQIEGGIWQKILKRFRAQ